MAKGIEREMKKFLFVIFSVPLTTPVWANPVPASFKLECPYPGSIFCQITGDTTQITKITQCGQLTTATPGAGKAYLIQSSLRENCSNTQAQRIGSVCADQKIHYIADRESGNIQSLLIYCPDETSIDIINKKEQPGCIPQDRGANKPNALETPEHRWLYCDETSDVNHCTHNTWVQGIDNKLYRCVVDSSGGKWNAINIDDISACRNHEGNIFYYDGRTFNDAPQYNYILSGNKMIGFKYMNKDSAAIERACFELTEACNNNNSMSGVCKDIANMPIWGQQSGTEQTAAKMYPADSGAQTATHAYTQTNSNQVNPATNSDLDLSEYTRSHGTPGNGVCDCDPDQYLETTEQTYNNVKYSICKCIVGYKRANGNYKDECVPANDTSTEKVLDTAKMRENAEKAYQDAKSHEQTLANKGLTAATTAATGLGTMTAASAYLEQRADAAAEADMRDYLATFKCEYGDGQTLNAGNEEITLPGGNELLEYYTEYKTLADSVKQKKTALGLRAGIESETLYDRAQSGLYQYTTKERVSGGEISLSRALSDETSADAAAWNAQKSETQSKLYTGAAVAVIGAAAGIAGNYLINRKYTHEELKDEFKEITKQLIQEHPQTFMPEPQVISETSQLIGISEPNQEQQEKLKLDIPAVSGTAFEQSSYKLNETGKQGLNDAIQRITDAMQQVPNAIISIQTIGHTDMVGISAKTQKEQGYKTNQELSEKRSQTVSRYLQDGLKSLGTRVRFGYPMGQGETWCRQKNKARDDTECRRVDINIEDITIYEQ
jgi:flagellar motor protein MotB